MAQKIRLGNIDVAIISEGQWREALALAERTQDVKTKDIKVLIVYPDGASIDDIQALIRDAKETAREI